MIVTRRSRALAAVLSFAIAGGIGALATPLAAQGVRGVIVTGDTIPVRGAVVSLVDSLGATGVTGLSDEFGRFELRAPRRGNWRLRTEAVGFARVTSFVIPLATAEIAVRRVQLTDVTARLRGIEVREGQRCDIRPAEGTQVAILWDEARKSLSAAQLSAIDAPALAYDQDEIEYDESFRRVRAASRTTTTGRAERGWRSDTPQALRQMGYARRIDTTSIYYAPDARVLLSDEFAASHCFRLIPDDPTSIRRVGIAFAPVGQTDGKLDVSGTLWLDRESYALDRVEFRYEPLLSADFPDSTFGGRVRFSRLATGHLLVTHWVLRMPIFAEADDGRLARSGQTSAMLIRPERREAVVGVKVARGAARAFDAPPEPLPVVNANQRRSVGAPGCEGAAPVGGNNGALLGDVRDARDRGVGGARVRAVWHQPVAVGGRMSFREQWVESGADVSGRFALCALPRGVTVTVTARSANAASPRTRLILPTGGTPPVASLELSAPTRGATAAPAPTTGAIKGRLLGANGRPVVGADIRIFPGIERVRTDSTGTFIVPDGPAGQRDIFVRRLGYVPTMASIEVSPGDTATILMSLAESAQSLAPVLIEAKITSMNLAGFSLRRTAGVGGGTFIGPEEVRARENGTVQTLLRTFARVRIEESAMTGDIRAYGRGGESPSEMFNNACSMRILVDGSPIPGTASLNLVPPLPEIAAIEVYQSIGAIPPQYSFAQPECGLIVIWTRSGAEP